MEKFMALHADEQLESDSFQIEGRVDKSIIDFSEEKAVDLIVMGTSGLTGVDPFMLGSVTEKMLRRADVPILTVRAPKD